MSLKLKVALCLAVSLYLLMTHCHVTDAQDQNQPTNNGDATQMSPESTTKKSSFFKGIKNWFKGSTTTPAPATGTAGAALVGSIHSQSGGLPSPAPSSQSPPNNAQPFGGSDNRDFVNSNAKPGNLPITPRPGSGPSQSVANRDFGGQNVRPGNLPVGSQSSLSYPQVGPNGLPIRPPPSGGFSQGSLSYPSVAPGTIPGQPGSSPQNQPSGNRDFVNTNVRPGTPSGPNQGLPAYPPSGSASYPGQAGPQPQSPTNRDFVNTNIRPGSPTPGSPLPGSPTPGSPTGGPMQPGSRPVTPTGSNQGMPSYPQSGPGAFPNQPGTGHYPQAPTNRDYVNPNARPGSLPLSPTSGFTGSPGQGQMGAMGGTPKPSVSTTNFPSPTQSTTGHRDFVNTTPKMSGPASVPSSPGQQPINPVGPWSNTPLPTNQNNPLANKEDFPPLPSPGRPGSPSRPGRPGVNFVPRPSSPTGSTTPRSYTNQLATDDEIIALTETLFTKDVNNQQKHITINYQGQTRSSQTTDEAPNPLLQVNDEALHSPTIEKMRPLFNNYELDTTVNEHVTPMERKEENELLDAILATSVMRQTMLFLQNKGLVSPDPKTHRDLLKTIWFTMYSRGGGRIGSSAFEHIFLSEIKNNTVSGLHNWVYYLEEERLGHIDYKGYIKKLELGNKGSIVKFRFNFKGIEKPVNSMFIGTSPELEMALYTVCFQVRLDQVCPVSMGGNKFSIQTYSFRYRGKTLIGSAFPEIP